jgi:leader peptidase (prepilin peptidase)/N-methyltransferase
MFLAGIFVVAAGLIIGSFLNVCIFRIPQRESIVTPRSHCRHCDRALKPVENIPLFSYLIQRGRCRGCGERVSWVYPTVEGLTGLCFLLLYLKYGFSSALLVNAIFVSGLIVLVFIDLFERILPNVITLGGTLLGFLLAPLQSSEFFQGPGTFWVVNSWLSSYANSFAGILFGGGFLWAVAYLYLKLRKREGLGFGDIKMMAMVGAFAGWKAAWLTILVGSLLGAVVGGAYIFLRSRERHYELPFGSFLGLTAITVSIYGPDFLRWYLGSPPSIS